VTREITFYRIQKSGDSNSRTLLRHERNELGHVRSSPAVSFAEDWRDSTLHIRAQAMLFLRTALRIFCERNRSNARREQLFSASYAAMQRESPPAPQSMVQAACRTDIAETFLGVRNEKGRAIRAALCGFFARDAP
jgi:hypothetical protein